MKKVLLLTLAALMISSVALADNVSMYSDISGTSCLISAAGFNSTAAVVHKFSLGATYSRFKVTLPAGSVPFGFTTCNAYPAIGVWTSDISVAYGGCLTGSWCVGTILAQLTSGEVKVEAADGQSGVLYTDCDFVEKVAGSGSAWVAPATGPCPTPTAQSTWGSVKALYR
jgi:hypothetical protein